MPVSFVAAGDASLLLPSSSSSSRPAGRLTLPFASIGSGLLGGSKGLQSVKEPKTGAVFPGEFCVVKKPCPRVTGTGVRAKRLLGIKNIDCYALALYVDPDVKGALGGKFAGAAPEQLAADQRLFDALLDTESLEKSMALEITSGLVKRQTFLDALAEQLEPPLKKSGDLGSLDAFKALFDGVQFRKGLPMSFTATRKGLVTRVDGQERGMIASKKFVRAFFNMYVGTSPVSKGAKESFGKGLASMVLA